MVRILQYQDVFKRVLPDNYMQGKVITGNESCSLPVDNVSYQIVTQADFIREFYPSGHRINDSSWYQDEIKKIKDEETGEEHYCFVPVERVSVSMQRVIVEKRLTHLCGNPIQITYSGLKTSKKQKDLIYNLSQGWENKNMNTAFFYLARSVYITGNGAFCGYINNKKFGWRVFSFLDGDTLYRKRDFVTGELEVFGRRFKQYDPSGNKSGEYMNVWDNQKIYTYRYAGVNSKRKKIKTDQLFGLDGWELIKSGLHGFDFVPVAYSYDPNGACWSFSQDNIEKLEVSLSRLREVNKSRAFPTLVVTANSVKIVRGNLNKPVSVIKINDPAGNAKILDGGETSQSFTLEIEKLLKFILMGSFIVLPPEERSGDESGASIKIKYSPSIEIAKTDANFFNQTVDDMLRIFKHGYGIEKGNVSDYDDLDVNASIKVYIHQNEAEYIEMLYKAVQAKFLSIESAATKSGLGTNDEYKRLENQAETELDAKKVEEVYDNENKKKVNNPNTEENE